MKVLIPLVIIGLFQPSCALLQETAHSLQAQAIARREQVVKSGVELATYAELLEPYASHPDLDVNAAAVRLFASIKHPNYPTAYILSPLVMPTIHDVLIMDSYIGNTPLDSLCTVEMDDWKNTELSFAMSEASPSESVNTDQDMVNKLIASTPIPNFRVESSVFIGDVLFSGDPTIVKPVHLKLSACEDKIAIRKIDTSNFSIIVVNRIQRDGTSSEYYIPLIYIQGDIKSFPGNLGKLINQSQSRLRDSKVFPGETLELLTSEEFIARMQLRYQANPAIRRKR